MRKLILFFLFTSPIIGQNLEIISDEELCTQIELATDYLEKDKDVDIKNFRFDSTIYNGGDYGFFFPLEYAAMKLNIPKDSIFDYDKKKINEIYTRLEEIDHLTIKLKLYCINRQNRPNISLSKLDTNNLLLNVTTKRLGRSGSSGIAYLFFFEKGKIVKVFKSPWIE